MHGRPDHMRGRVQPRPGADTIVPLTTPRAVNRTTRTDDSDGCTPDRTPAARSAGHGGRRSPDSVIEDFAARQHGVVSRAQLLRAGVGGHLVDHRVRRGRLHVLHRGVYRVGPLRVAQERPHPRGPCRIGRRRRARAGVGAVAATGHSASQRTGPAALPTCRRPGVPDLCALLAANAEPALARSEAESRLHELIRRGRLPQPVANAVVRGF